MNSVRETGAYCAGKLCSNPTMELVREEHYCLGCSSIYHVPCAKWITTLTSNNLFEGEFICLKCTSSPSEQASLSSKTLHATIDVASLSSQVPIIYKSVSTLVIIILIKNANTSNYEREKSIQNNITSSSSTFASRSHNTNSNTLSVQELLSIAQKNSLDGAACNNIKELNNAIINGSSINTANFIEVKIRPEEGDTAPAPS